MFQISANLYWQNIWVAYHLTNCCCDLSQDKSGLKCEEVKKSHTTSYLSSPSNFLEIPKWTAKPFTLFQAPSWEPNNQTLNFFWVFWLFCFSDLFWTSPEQYRKCTDAKEVITNFQHTPPFFLFFRLKEFKLSVKLVKIAAV